MNTQNFSGFGGFFSSKFGRETRMRLATVSQLPVSSPAAWVVVTETTDKLSSAKLCCLCSRISHFSKEREGKHLYNRRVPASPFKKRLKRTISANPARYRVARRYGSYFHTTRPNGFISPSHSPPSSTSCAKELEPVFLS